MLEALVHFEPDISPTGPMTSLEEAQPTEILEAQLRAADWLEELSGGKQDQIEGELDRAAARNAFKALTTLPKEEQQRCALLALKTPIAVRHVTGMLAAYDWEFVEQAKELRGYVVAKLVEESQNPTASIRLKALQQLGKVTEVGLFTDKIEVTKKDLTDSELEQRIKEKLNRFMGVVDVVEVLKDDDTLSLTHEEGETPAAPSEGTE